MYETIKKLRAGEPVDFEGVQLEMDDSEIMPGDVDIAERNSGPKLLTAQSVHVKDGWIVPTSLDYPFDLGECVKVREVTT